MVKLKQNELLGTKGYIYTAAYQFQKKKNVKVFAIFEYLPTSKKTTLVDKKTLCNKNTQTTKSSKILGQESTLSEKVLSSYWSESTEELLKRLSSHIKTGCVDLVLNCLKNSVNLMGQPSWFSITQSFLHKKNSFKTYAQSFMFSPVEFTDSDDTLMGLKKIRVYPKTKEQQKILDELCGASRYYFNKTVEHLKKPNTKANRFAIQKDLLADVPEWAEKVPYKVKQMAIEDACIAVRNAKKKSKASGEINKVSFRNKKKKNDSFYVPKGSVKETGIFPKLLKELKVTEEVGSVDFDCRLVHQDGRYFLCVPYQKQIKVPDSQRKPFISLDPGVRTFLTGFTFDGFCEIGSGDFQKIFRLLYRLDELISKRSKGSKKRWNKPISNLKFRIRNLITEIHQKTANILVRCFDNIIIPDFSASQMVTKLRSKTCRAMLGWAHSKFRELLKYKAKEYSANIVIQNEAYTSKTCSFCGKIHNIGSKKVLKCGCGITIDRDWNGARGIFLRAMLDQPELKNSVLVNFC